MWDIECEACRAQLESQWLTRSEFEKFLEEETCGVCGGKIRKSFGVGRVFFNGSGYTKRST